ncbi:MAG: hypothetical protein N3I35_03210 [Clostridia bacterium]|nr:hypothetical protein [Clostridia bacterium]
MSGNLAFLIITVVGLFSVSTTIILGLFAKRKIYKYLPAAFICLSAIVFCIVMTILFYSNYIGIVYIVVLMSTAPGIFLSLVTAFLFDLSKYIMSRKKVS